MNSIDKPNHSAVSLRIFGDALDPNQITALLKCSPDRSHRKDDLILRQDGTPYWNENTKRHSIQKTGMWSLKASASEPADIEGQMQNLLSQLPRDLSVWNEISVKFGFEIDFFCGFFMHRSNEGLVLSSQTLKEMADRHIELQLDIYSPDEDDLREQRLAYEPPI